MIRFVLIFWLLLTSVCGYSQELANFYIEPNTAESVVLHTRVFRHSFSVLGGAQIDYESNLIEVSLCYQNTFGQVYTFDPQEFVLDLPPGYSEYTVNVKVYGDEDGPPCTTSNQTASRSYTFEWPYNPTQTTTIPDDVFEDYLENLGAGDDIPNNDLVYTHRIHHMSHLFLNNQVVGISGIVESMEGLTEFPYLKVLRCSSNEITELDVSQNPLLEELRCSGNPIESLDLTNNPLLWFLMTNNTSITSLDLSNNTQLEWLDASNNALSQIDLSANVALWFLRLSDCGLNELDISQNTMLVSIAIGYNNLAGLDFTNNNQLEEISVLQNSLIELDVSNLPNLKGFSGSNNHFTSLDFSANPQLEVLGLFQNDLSSLNLKNGQTTGITNLVTIQNANLACIEVDDPSEAPFEGWTVDSHTGFSSDCSLGLTVLEKEAIWLHPNPVQSVAYLQSPYPVRAIKLYGIGGNLVREFYSTRLALDILEAGIYFAKVQTSEGTATVKVVKQ